MKPAQAIPGSVQWRDNLPEDHFTAGFAIQPTHRESGIIIVGDGAKEHVGPPSWILAKKAP
jgi:hypothetical protein